ncbi:MAG: GntR family transcriptional regulator [Firmicutes bacterium]|nr:GntR family transcriptional regulator [Bacillota bacterium]
MKSYFISSKSDTSIYQQLYDQIEAQILSGELKSGTNLPSIRTMAKELRVSVITIKKTWEELEKSGYILTISGKGSYITTNSKETLKKKKFDLVKDIFRDNILQCKTLEISKKEIIDIIEDLYDVIPKKDTH